MISSTRACAALTLFNEKLDALRYGRFVRSLKRSGYGYNVRFPTGKKAVTKLRPAEDAIRAALLTIRFFVQDNEPCSFRNLSKIYVDLRIPAEIRIEFRDRRKLFNDYLDSEEHVSLHLSSQRMTPRKVFAAVTYGDLAHSTRHHRVLYKKLSAGPLQTAFSHQDYVRCLIVLLKFAFSIGRLNKQVLRNGYLALGKKSRGSFTKATGR